MKKLVIAILFVAGLGAAAAVADLLGFAEIGKALSGKRDEYSEQYRSTVTSSTVVVSETVVQ